MKLIMIYGRMNPIHQGHAEMLLQTKKRAFQEGAEFRVFLTRTQDSELNPLSYRDKLRFLRLVVGTIPVDETRPVQNIFRLLGELSETYSEIELVCGGDRHSKFEDLISQYQSDFKCPIWISNFADRDKYPYSATEMRRLAVTGDYQGFMNACPKMFTPTQKIQLFSLVSVGLTKPIDGRNRTRALSQSQE